MNIAQLPIIMTSMSRHDHLSSASLSLAKELSKKTQVFYINNPRTIKFNFIGHMRVLIVEFSSEFPNLKVIESGSVLPINFLPKGIIYNFFSKVNDFLFTKTFFSVLKESNISQGKYIFFNSFNPFYGFQAINRVKPALIIYQSRDDIEFAPYVNKHGIKKEIKWLKEAKLVYATGIALCKKLSKNGEVKVRHLPNGANIELFKRGFIKEVPRTNIIGYIGEIETRVDFDLLVKLANQYDDKIILLIGPCQQSTIDDFRIKCPNVVFGGFRKYENLPDLVKSFQCAIIPFKKNELTYGIYPLKVNEYLAAGIPVVTTDFSPDIQNFKDIIYISKDHQDFLHLTSEAIANDEISKRTDRTNFAKENNWSKRVAILISDIEKEF